MTAPRTTTDLSATSSGTGGGGGLRDGTRVARKPGRHPWPRHIKRSKTLFKHIRKQDDKSLLEQGFTLIELLVVVAILGILATVAIFAVGNLTDTAKKNSCGTEASTVETAAEATRPDGHLPGRRGRDGRARRQPQEHAEVPGRGHWSVVLVRLDDRQGHADAACTV